ncbi:NAD(P)-dependent oxidoreductase [Salinispira pacifica]
MWTAESVMKTLKDKRALITGTASGIGREIALRARAFGMQILAYDPYVRPELLAELDARSGSLEEVASQSDFLAMAAKVTPETIGLFSERHFTLMKPSAYFINTARAALVDYGALYRALSRNRIAGAAIDVYTSEPIPPDEPLRKLSNVLLSPHLAGASRDIPRNHSRIIVEQLSHLLDGVKPQFMKNPDVWEKRRPV